MVWSLQLLLVAASAIVATGLAAYLLLERRWGGHWVRAYLSGGRAAARRREQPRVADETHVLLCVADHYEPQHGGVNAEVARRRVGTWVDSYPKLFEQFKDADGRPPRHSFFYPLEMYDEAEMDGITGLCRGGFGEVEIHLHHDRDTADNLRRRLTEYKHLLAERHGQLARHGESGELVYGFVHGNWALDNSRPDGRWCGVNNELDVLRETGCYADFTMPSAPNPAQTRKINSIYYAADDPARPKSHDRGTDVGSGPRPANSLMLIQGPLLPDWGRRKLGLLPRLENGDIHGGFAPTMARLNLWLKARVQVPTRPDWFFVKLHTHGAPERNQAVLLGEAMVRFHAGLAERATKDPGFHVHYVTAREMYNLARAAEAGWAGPVDEARDFELAWNGQPSAVPA